MSKIKMPLSVYVLYHKDSKEGTAAYTEMYHMLCRNPERPLADGIDIPVFLRTGGESHKIPEIQFDQSSKNAIFLLVDELMYCCPTWNVYIETLLKSADYNTLIYPISLCKYAYDINAELKEKQFITLNSYSLKENWGEFQTRVFDVLIRLITNKETEKLKLFISHSKKEKDNLGEMKAAELRAFLRINTKLDSFFDANDIIDGYDFGEQINTSVEKSLFIVLETNTYSEREWCKIEALTGKKNKVPGIVVSLVSGAVKRGFPYLGNMPLVRYNNNWNDIINLLLRTALNQYYQEQLLTQLKEYMGSTDYDILPFSPELLSICLIDKKKKILYPEPPLGSEEIDFLKLFEGDVSFITPVQALSNLTGSLAEKNIAISISDSDDIQEYGGNDTLLRDITIELSRHILVAGGKLTYGGDLRRSGFTDLFADLSFQYGQSEKTDRNTKYFTNYFAWPIYLNMTKIDEANFEQNRVSIKKVGPPNECPTNNRDRFVPPNTVGANFLWAKSLTMMREEMESTVDARIILGGRTHGFKGKYAGVLEEFIISQKNNHPVYLLGGFGGVSNALVNIIEGNSNESFLYDEATKNSYYVELLEYYNQTVERDEKINYPTIYETIYSNGISGLNNGLSEEENRILFKSTNVLEIVALIMKGLNLRFKSI